VSDEGGGEALKNGEALKEEKKKKELLNNLPPQEARPVPIKMPLPDFRKLASQQSAPAPSDGVFCKCIHFRTRTCLFSF